MSLSSSSSMQDAKDQYNDNLLWEGDTTKASNCLEAIRYILANRPIRVASDTESMDYESLKDQVQQIKDYLGSATTTINKTSFTRGRMLL